MAFGVKFVPLTPGAYSPTQNAEASCSKLTDEQVLRMREHMSPEAYKRELIALRERDMAITKPTQPEYFARSRRLPTVQIASPPYDLSFTNYGIDFSLLDESYFAYPPYFMTSPTDTDTYAWDLNFDLDFDLDVDPAQLEAFAAQIYPNGRPSDSDVWDLYQDQDGMDTDTDTDSNTDMSTDISEDDAAASISIDDDDSLQILFEEFDNVFGDITLPNADPDPSSSADSTEC